MAEPCAQEAGHFSAGSFALGTLSMGLIFSLLLIAVSQDDRHGACKAAIEAKADSAVLLAVCR